MCGVLQAALVTERTKGTTRRSPVTSMHSPKQQHSQSHHHHINIHHDSMRHGTCAMANLLSKLAGGPKDLTEPVARRHNSSTTDTTPIKSEHIPHTPHTTITKISNGMNINQTPHETAQTPNKGCLTPRTLGKERPRKHACVR